MACHVCFYVSCALMYCLNPALIAIWLLVYLPHLFFLLIWFVCSPIYCPFFLSPGPVFFIIHFLCLAPWSHVMSCSQALSCQVQLTSPVFPHWVVFVCIYFILFFLSAYLSLRLTPLPKPDMLFNILYRNKQINSYLDVWVIIGFWF